MSEVHRIEQAVTVAAFDAFLDAQQDDMWFELIAGQIVAMTNPSEVHAQIASNTGAPLKLEMDVVGCGSYQGGIGVQRSDDRPEHSLIFAAMGFSILLERTYFGVPLMNIRPIRRRGKPS